MPSPVPTPVAAAIGLLPTFAGGVRRLPGKALRLPILAVSSALNTVDAVRHEYDDLAQRGQQLVDTLRGTTVNDVEDRLGQVVEDTPLAGVYERAEGLAEDVAHDVAGAVDAARQAVDAAGGDVAGAVDAARQAVDADGLTGDPLPAAESPKGAPTPKATEPAAERVDTAATSAVVETVEQVVELSTAPPVASRGELPLADYDHMTLGALRGRLRSLSVPELVQVREYEKEHADRLPVVTMLDNRIAKLATDGAAAPSPGGLPSAGTTPAATPAVGKVSGPSGAHTSPPRTKVRTT